MKAKETGDDLKDRYYELLTLQKRVNHVLEVQSDDGAAEVQAANLSLSREVDKLVKLDGNPEIFKAIARAAWEAPDSEEFARLAKETDAKIKLKALTCQYGSPASFRKSIRKSEDEIRQKEGILANEKSEVERLQKQLAPIEEHNSDRKTMSINTNSRERIEDSGFLERIDNTDLRIAYKMAGAYAEKNGKRKDGYFRNANCFDDRELLDQEKRLVQDLTSEIDFMQDKHYQRLAAYKEVRDVQKVLEGYGVNENSSINLDAFQKEFCKRLQDDNFIACFARETASGVGGSIILAALSARIRTKIQDSLVSYKENVNETTKVLEGPIGTIAKAMNARRAIDGIDRDIKSQAVMAGYLASSAASAFKSLSSFRPDHTEGPVSLTRDIHLHMVVDGNIDPAYIHEVYGMDRLLTKHFNVNVTRPSPDFERVLANPVAVERIDRHYAAFLRDNAGDENINAVGFAAGQFDDLSVEMFLGRYFKAGATQDQMVEELEKEASKIEAVEEKRVNAGLQPGGPKIPGNI